MSSWDYKREGQASQGLTDPASGTEAGAGFKAGQQPAPSADVKASKRNVVLLANGWVRRQIKQGPNLASARVIDEVLVPAHPAIAGAANSGYANVVFTGFPDICEVFVQSGNVTANGVSNVYVVFNEPLSNTTYGAGNTLTLTVANTISGNHAVFYSNNAVGLLNANNTIVFQNRAGLQGATGSGAATYQVNAQSISVTGGGNPLKSTNPGARSANLVITGAVSNTTSTFTVSV